MLIRRRRPWQVFVRDIGPTFTFATGDKARARATELVATGGYAEALVTCRDSFGIRQTYRFDGPPLTEKLVSGRWVKTRATVSAAELTAGTVVSWFDSSVSEMRPYAVIACERKPEGRVRLVLKRRGRPQVEWSGPKNAPVFLWEGPVSHLDLPQQPDSIEPEGSATLSLSGSVAGEGRPRR